MNKDTKLNEKLYQYLAHLFDTKTTYDVHEFLIHSEIHIERDYSSSFRNAKKLGLIVDPEIYKKYQGKLNQFKDMISAKFDEFSNSYITNVKIFPNLNKFQILNNRITPINTPWEEVNSDQNILLNQLRTASENVDYQNIGNTSRTLLQKVSNIVFDLEKHKAHDKSIDLSEGKFKNRLHTYIKTELGGSSNKELRDYSVSVITTAEKSVDLANKLTHDINANLMMAESCVISTITAISIIKLIEDKPE
ncbi:hypothetical protein ACKGJO_00910 [Gracilimonas sp. Q87]|uniref:hypothetical protein n=1 Tax=Gracilimonas sp. Q87 TaxID=3384766 RepID=UPI003983EC29